MIANTNLGILIYNRRNELHLSKAQFAAELNVSIRTITHWEGCQRFPSLKNLINISFFLKIPIKTLLC